MLDTAHTVLIVLVYLIAMCLAWCHSRVLWKLSPFGHKGKGSFVKYLPGFGFALMLTFIGEPAILLFPGFLIIVAAGLWIYNEQRKLPKVPQ
jgi:hypothetical protein